MEVTAKKIITTCSVITGVAGVIAIGIVSYNHFMPRAEAQMDHVDIQAMMAAGDAKVAEYDEIGNLETQVSLARLEVKQLNGTMERRPLTADETTNLSYLIEKITLLEQRLADLQAALRAGA